MSDAIKLKRLAHRQAFQAHGRDACLIERDAAERGQLVERSQPRIGDRRFRQLQTLQFPEGSERSQARIGNLRPGQIQFAQRRQFAHALQPVIRDFRRLPVADSAARSAR